MPADRKWYRNWAVGQLVLATLRDLDPQYPVPDLDVEALRARLLAEGWTGWVRPFGEFSRGVAGRGWRRTVTEGVPLARRASPGGVRRGSAASETRRTCGRPLAWVKDAACCAGRRRLGRHPARGRHSADRARPDFWRRQRPPMIVAAAIGIVIALAVVIALLG